MTATADILIENARVLTMDEGAPRAEAIAVKGNRIVAVGTRAEVGATKGAGTRVIDAGRATVLPGFIEGHIHIFPGGTSLDGLSLESVSGLDALKSAVRAFAAKRPDHKIVFARQANYTILGVGVQVTRHHLDEVLPDRPFAMVAPDGHTVWANTRALELGGLLHGKETIPGSEIVMAADGKASGELREPGAYGVLNAFTPTGGREVLGLRTGDDPETPPTAAEREGDRQILRNALDYCASLGITSFQNMDGNRYQLALLEEIDEASGLKVRAQIPFHMMNHMALDRLEEAVAMRARWAGGRLKSGMVKVFMDGVIDSSTAFMLSDYADRPGVIGDPWFSAEHFAEIATRADRLGLQIAVHAIGDAAVRRTLDGYEAAQRANGRRDSRHRIEHIESIDPADIPRFAGLGVIASMQPTHAPGFVFPPEPTVSRLGARRLKTAYAWQTIRKTGAHMSFSSDWPVAPLDPILSLKAALVRRPLTEGAPDERQSLEDALAGYTRDGAHAEFAEGSKGRLKSGMLADIVVLSGDIEATPAEALTDLKAAITICDGRITHGG
ncbi:MAG: amidohydrolase [Hyphomicrobiaceae bacterium]